MAQKQVIPVDTSLAAVNPASDENVALLRRIVKLLETSGVQDSSQRQRITIDASPNGITLANAANVAGLVCIAASTAGGNVPIFMVDQRYEMADRARMAYAIGIRNNLTFS